MATELIGHLVFVVEWVLPVALLVAVLVSRKWPRTSHAERVRFHLSYLSTMPVDELKECMEVWERSPGRFTAELEAARSTLNSHKNH